MRSRSRRHEVRVDDEVGDLLELGARAAGGRRRERGARVAVRLRRQLARPVEPELADVGALAVALVAALRLAQGVVGPGHVEDVVDDLEQHAELAAKRTEASSVGDGSPSARRAGRRTRPTRRSAGRSSARAGGAGRRALGGRRRHVEVLAADHAVDAGRGGELARRPRGSRAGSPALLVQHEPERLGVERRRRRGSRRPRRTRRGRSAGRGAGRRRPSPAGRRGSASRCGSARARRRAAAPSRGSRPSARGRREREHRPDALAAGEQRVAHRLLEAGRRRARATKRSAAR